MAMGSLRVKTVVFSLVHVGVIKWKHFPRYWPFVRGIHRPSVNSPHKGQWCRALMFSLICIWINGWVNNRAAGDLRRHHPHYDVTVMRSDKIYNEDLIRRDTIKPTWHFMREVMKAHVTTCNCYHQSGHPKLIFSIDISICYSKTGQQCT